MINVLLEPKQQSVIIVPIAPFHANSYRFCIKTIGKPDKQEKQAFQGAEHDTMNQVIIIQQFKDKVYIVQQHGIIIKFN